MEILGEGILIVYCETHADLRIPAKVWLNKVRSARWENPNELKVTFPAASLLGARKVVFNLKGNRYRLVAEVDYRRRWVRIKRVGTHSEYSKWKL